MTLANAMDVGKPSNIERLQYLYPTHQAIKNNVRAFSVSDHEISTTIAQVYKKYDMLICPHTATAFFVREQLSTQPWMVVATADPCKFDTVIEPIIKKPIAIAPQLQELLNRPEHLFEVAPNLEAVTLLANKYFNR
jgi:threonine synthase